MWLCGGIKAFTLKELDMKKDPFDVDEAQLKQDLKDVFKKHGCIRLHCLCAMWDIEAEWLELSRKNWSADVLPRIKPRRPYYDNEPNGYLESDRDFLENNLELAIEYLEMLERDAASAYSPFDDRKLKGGKQ